MVFQVPHLLSGPHLGSNQVPLRPFSILVTFRPLSNSSCHVSFSFSSPNQPPTLGSVHGSSNETVHDNPLIKVKFGATRRSRVTRSVPKNSESCPGTIGVLSLQLDSVDSVKSSYPLFCIIFFVFTTDSINQGFKSLQWLLSPQDFTNGSTRVYRRCRGR